MPSKVVSDILWTLSTNASFPNVDVSLTSLCQHQICYTDWTYGEWTMYLQRSVDGGTSAPAYQTIGTRTGYVSQDSPSNRTFTNVRNQGIMRVVVQIAGSAYHGPVHFIEYI
ncbi:hypothetical protein [Gracilibacillus timonensis]|uniref:hypothetical protein n=1 Tax=Gracilibacillus timonensis TaxID=1816696 RepID=UPI000824286E|nr:hypothetical protein [Gracilibacillus timonensis]